MRGVNGFKNSSLVFSKRRTVSQTLRKKKSTPWRNIFLPVGIVFMALLSVLGGHMVARMSSFPFTISGSSEALVKPIAPSNRDDATLTEELKKKGISYENITYASKSSTLILELSKDTFVYLDKSGSASAQIEALSKILQRSNIENPQKKVSYIDLRFDKPIVKFK